MTLRVWTCTNFRGHWPVGAAATIVAANEDEAKKHLLDALAQIGLTQSEEDAADLKFEELPMVDGLVRVLVDGNY